MLCSNYDNGTQTKINTECGMMFYETFDVKELFRIEKISNQNPIRFRNIKKSKQSFKQIMKSYNSRKRLKSK